jgi:diaminopimelate decarboxylase
LSDRTSKLKSKSLEQCVDSRPFHYRGRALWCDGVSLEALAEQHGTPLYVYSAEQIRYRFSLFQRAFAGRPFTICYAVKANSALGILRMLAELGAGNWSGFDARIKLR